MPKEFITFNRKELVSLKRAYSAALNKQQDVFLFQGKKLLTCYAKYLIDYLDSKFNSSR